MAPDVDFSFHQFNDRLFQEDQRWTKAIPRPTNSCFARHHSAIIIPLRRSDTDGGSEGQASHADSHIFIIASLSHQADMELEHSDRGSSKTTRKRRQSRSATPLNSFQQIEFQRVWSEYSDSLLIIIKSCELVPSACSGDKA